MSRPLAALFAVFLIAAADTAPLPHAAGLPAGPGRNCGGGYTVARGDTLYSIARRCGATVAELVRWNELGNPPRLEPGQALDIAIEVSTSSRANHLPRPTLPTLIAPTAPLRPLPRTLLPVPPRPVAPPPDAAAIYHFQAGDTLYSLARWARTSLAALRAANPDVEARDIEVGDPIRLPRGAVRPEALRLRERGRPAPVAVVAPPPPPPPVIMPPRPPAVRPPPPPPDEDEPDKPMPEDEDGEGPTPGGMDDGGPEPDGM